MNAFRPALSITERIDEALAAAAAAGRDPVAVVLGKQDHPDLMAWIGAAPERETQPPSYRGVPVRLNKAVFLSRLELVSKPGHPNALLL